MNPVEFKKIVKAYYKKNGRHDLPWRKNCTPYRIVVSELMLQQTQVDRVIPYFKKWLKQFPNWQILAKASSHDVLSAWKGLGYNSRALRLQKLAQSIVDEHSKDLSLKKIQSLEYPAKFFEKLPGIGPYTAGAILAFAYDIPHPCIETNIRRVYIHHFFSDQTNISDKKILEKITETLPKKMFDSGIGRSWTMVHF